MKTRLRLVISRRRGELWCIWLVAALCCGVPPVAAGDAELATRLAELVTEYESHGNAIVGISTDRVIGGERIFAHNADRPLTPASNQKLLTTVFALERLGKDFHFATKVYQTGDDLVVVGDFDPLLGDPLLAAADGGSVYDELDRWSAAVRTQVGASITGDLLLVCDTDAAKYRHADWPTSQRDRWYCAPVARLNFHDNCFDVTLSVAGNSVTAAVMPQSSLTRVENGIRKGDRHLWSLRTADDEATLLLAGTATTGTLQPFSVAIDNPPMLLGRVFADRLARSGVRLGGRVRKVAPGGVDLSAAKLVVETRTPLTAALARANKPSLNMTAECIFLRAGDGTWAGSAALATQTLVARFALDESGLDIRDGGGLSSRNKVAAADITSLLVAAMRKDYALDLLNSLAISGFDGTMQSRLGEGLCRGRVWAKTGSIAGVSSLSGYVIGADSRPAIAFSILINRISASQAGRTRQLQDDIARLLVEHVMSQTSSSGSDERR